jgi:hypothetical protein
MSGRPLTQSERALQQEFVLFGESLSQLAESGLTNTYNDIFRFSVLEIIDYLLLRCLHTGTSPFEELAEEWLHYGVV